MGFPSVVENLHALHLGVDVENLFHDVLGVLPVVGLHAARGVDHEDDPLAVHRDAADREHVRIAPRRVLEQALHLGGQRLVRGHEFRLDDVGDGRLALAGFEFAADLRQIAGERRGLLLLGW